MPAYDSPKRFPGSQHLPELAQTLLQRFFPPDQLPTPGMAMSNPKAIDPIISGLDDVFRGGGNANMNMTARAMATPQVKQAMGEMGEQGPQKYLNELMEYLADQETDQAANHMIDGLFKTFFGR